MNKEHFSLTYFLSRPFFFGIIYSQIFSLSQADSIIACLLGTIIGAGILYTISKMKLDNSSRVLQLLFYLFLLILALSSIETYVSSYLLVKTPKIVYIIPAIILITYVSLKDTKSLKKVSVLFMIISITSFSSIIFLLSNYININNVLPLFTQKPISVFKSSLIFGNMSSLPNILLKEENIDIKKQIFYYFVTSLINTFLCILTLSALTPEVAKIYSYPEYMVLKRIKLFDFIENTENLSVLMWYFDYFFLLSMVFKKILTITKKRIVFIFIIILTTLFTTFCIANDFSKSMWLYNYSPLIMGIFFCLFIFTIFKSNVKYK